MATKYINEVDEALRDSIVEATDEFEQIKAAHEAEVRGAGEDRERLEAAKPDFYEPIDALESLIEQVKSNLNDLEVAKQGLEEQAERISEEHEERVEALEEEDDDDGNPEELDPMNDYNYRGSTWHY